MRHGIAGGMGYLRRGRWPLEVAGQMPDGGDMDVWRIGRLVILTGGLGLLVGAALAGLDEDAHRGQPGDAVDLLGRSNEGGVALSLLVLGLAAWHFWAPGLGKLVVVGLVAAGGLWFTLVDSAYGTQEPLWSQGYEGVELVARWVVTASAAVVLVGVLWSFVELIWSSERRSKDRTAIPDVPVGDAPITRGMPGGRGRSPLVVAGQWPVGRDLDGWRIGRLVILAGGLGMVVGVALAAGPQDSETGLGLALSLLLLGLAAWHFWAWGLGRLVAIGLLAAGALQFTLVDFADGEPIWSQGYSGDDLVGNWLVIASASVVLIGVVWSLIEVVGSAERRSQEVAASVAWWRKWGLMVVGVAVALWVLGQVFSETENAPPIETADEGNDGRVLEDEWTITPDGDADGSYIFSMIKTFGPLDEADVEDLGGRFVWPETEIEMCDVNIWGVGDGFVQIGIISPTTEGCPGMLPAFVDFGLPQTACLFFRSDGTDDEFCAPLTVG